MMFNVSFSYAGFWIALAGIALVSTVVLVWLLRWIKMGKDRARSQLFSAFALGGVSFYLLTVASGKVYFPFCYWLAGKLGL